MSQKAKADSGRAPRFDVVVPIYNSFHVARLCLSALERTSPPEDVRVTCVLDACDDHTVFAVKQWCAARPNSRAIEMKHNVGFVGACNSAMQLATGEFVVLVNSDACATQNWPALFAACFASDDRIAIASPLSNFCPHNSVPMQPGTTLTQMAATVAAREPVYPDITTCEGFFFAIRRKALDELGFFDGLFGRGYCEESDLSLRANYFGWRTVLVDNAYIFHFGRESFGMSLRQAQYEKNKRALFDRWGKRYEIDFKAMQAADAMSGIRRSLVGETKLQAVKWVE